MQPLVIGMAALMSTCILTPLPAAQAEKDELAQDARATGMRLAKQAIDEMETKDKERARLGTLIAEGDSWFDYPRSDVLKELWAIGYDVASVAERGDTAENMIYGPGSLRELAAEMDSLRRREERPVGILLSAGGNDIAGPELAMLLNHAGAGVSPLDDEVVALVLDKRLRRAMISLVVAVGELRSHYFDGNDIPIVFHGYDCPVPDGRGFLSGFWFLPGPWLEPSLKRKGIVTEATDLPQGKEVMCTLIGRFNAMLERVAREAEVENVRYVSLLGTLSSGDDYRDWWGNELHATPRGYEEIARRLDAAIRSGSP